jgi:hypothetical protein
VTASGIKSPTVGATRVDAVGSLGSLSFITNALLSIQAVSGVSSVGNAAQVLRNPPSTVKGVGAITVGAGWFGSSTNRNPMVGATDASQGHGATRDQAAGATKEQLRTGANIS